MKRTLFSLPPFEFWPMWAIYLPIIPYGLFLCIRSLNMRLIAYINPTEPMSGVFGEHKYARLTQISEKNKLKMLFVKKEVKKDKMLLAKIEKEIGFPAIFKPDHGYRGYSASGLPIFKIENKEEAKKVLKKVNEDLIIQAFSNLEQEFGVFYVNLPDGPKITSLMGRKFLSVQGNGKDNVLVLLKNKPRDNKYVEHVTKTYPEKLKIIPKDKEQFIIEPIGNHCRGTQFLDFNHHVSEELLATFDALATQMDELHYARFDVKAKSIKAMERGEFKVLEVNGFNAEPVHFYADEYQWWRGWWDLLLHYHYAAKIARNNKKRGAKTAKPDTFFAILKYCKDRLL